MKFYPFLVLFFFTFSLKSQITYEFLQPLPPDGKEVVQVDLGYFGQYKNEGNGTILQCDLEGITMISTIYGSVTLEDVRENSKYFVRNGWLHGIVANDSLPCVLADNQYHFGIRKSERLIGAGSPHKLIKVADRKYIINFKEQWGYSPSLLTFKGKSIHIEHFTYPSTTAVFDTIKQQEQRTKDASNYVLLSPTLKEWQQLAKSLIFEAPMIFERLP